MRHFKFETVESTNLIARDKLSTQTEIFAVSADYQTGGQGRNSKVWLGDNGDNIFLSVGIKHNKPIKIEEAVIYQGLGCLAVKEILYELTQKDIFRLKYPNDVMAKDEEEYKKICGVIINNGFIGDRCDFTILGIGVNINQSFFENELSNTAISLKQLGFNFDKNEVLDLLINKIEYYNNLDYKKVAEIWIKNLDILNKKIQIIGKAEEFRVIDILEDGRLKVINEVSGEIEFIDNGDSIRYNYD
jgi:BirA family biotin operon repressor/biotin-[acetyl-CoA-carboxylase] ligase